MRVPLEIASNLAAVSSGLFPLIADEVGVLPFISPVIKDAMWKITALLAGLSAVVSYQMVAFLAPRILERWVIRCFWATLWIGLVIAFISLVVMICTTTELVLAAEPAAARVAVMTSYCLCFVGLGSSIGTVIGLWRVG